MLEKVVEVEVQIKCAAVPGRRFEKTGPCRTPHVI